MTPETRHTLAQLRALPTLSQGHFDNLKVEADGIRVWLSRCTMADGEPYDNKVTVEVIRNGVWTEHRTYQAR
jgi:hypothetical protein